MSYIEDFSPVPMGRYAQAQTDERRYWDSEGGVLLTLQAQYYFYSGYYEWTKHGALIDPFCENPARPESFQLSPDEIAGTIVLDVGCGPTSETLSLVHCATVHVLDPLIDHYRGLQPFGWEFFYSVHAIGAEQLPFETETIDVVHCRNVLDHTQDADRIICEIARVLRPGGQLLLNCDLRAERGGGPAHPYKWSREAFEERVFAQFEPVTNATVIDAATRRVATGPEHSGQAHWICRLQRRPQ